MPLGIPHSKFLSWPQSDQDKALAYMRAKAQVCEMCGSREVDWVDPETGRILQEPIYTPVGVKCHGCAEIEQYRNSTFNESGPPAGVRIVLYPDELVDQDGRIITGHNSKSNGN